MARIGLNNFRYSPLTEGSDGTPSYEGAYKPAKAISCSVSITNNNAVLYADDAVAESDTSFQTGSVTIGIDDEDQATMAALLGHEVDAGGEMVRSSNDLAPYVGLGRVVVKMVGGQRRYKVEFLYKVKFAEPSADEQTKGETLEFGTSEMEGQIATLADGRWSCTKTFASQEDALTYLEGLLGGSPTGEDVTLTYNVNGGTGTVAAVEAKSGAAIYLNDGSGITPPSGKVFIGWDTSASSTSADVKSPFIITEDTTLYAIYATE